MSIFSIIWELCWKSSFPSSLIPVAIPVRIPILSFFHFSVWWIDSTVRNPLNFVRKMVHTSFFVTFFSFCYYKRKSIKNTFLATTLLRNFGYKKYFVKKKCRKLTKKFVYYCFIAIIWKINFKYVFFNLIQFNSLYPNLCYRSLQIYSIK